LLLRLPLTLAIIPSLIVGIAGQRFAIPQINLVELVHIRAEDISSRIEKVGSAAVLRLRGQLLPLLKLADVLELSQTVSIDGPETAMPNRRKEIADAREGENVPNRRTSARSGYNVIVLRAGNHQFGLIVDELFDTEEIVVKSLSSFLKGCRCFSGSTIMGDGRVAMILDPNGIIAHTGLSFENIESERQKLEAMAKQKDATVDSQTLLFFNNAARETFAVPLTDVLRLEKFNPSEITRMGSREFINYEGRGLPLMRLEHYIPVGAFPDGQTEAYLIIPKQGDGQVGLIVSRILDTQDCAADWEKKEDHNPAISGWAVINNTITVRLDFRELLTQAGFDTQLNRGEAA
jgi:two-component system chemotaxis sensor kinase CheA